MIEKIQAIRGMNDILPEQAFAWQEMEAVFRQCMFQYGYKEIRLPLLENTKLFKRTIGEITDIVEKEMYTFEDLNGESISLRPEGTAGCLRACLEHGLLHNLPQKLWYTGPMFRHEKPQKGRYRQFYQLGVEALGIDGIAIEIELILLVQRMWKLLGISDVVELELNTIGNLQERNKYKETLVQYLTPLKNKLDEDSQRRLTKNPLRILDSKNPEVKKVLHNAPILLDHVSKESKERFDNLCSELSRLNINFIINPFLVRGLDYYSHTVFEWTTDKLGSQATICAGGRFDSLIEQIGGISTPGVGFAVGMERLLLLQDTININFPKALPMIFCIAVGDKAQQKGLEIAEAIRNYEPNWQIIVNTSGGSFKSQFKKADKSNARLALVIGDDEINSKEIGVKDLRLGGDQVQVLEEDIIAYLQTYIATHHIV